MKAIRPQNLLVLFSFIWLLPAYGVSEEVKLTLRCARNHYKVGDTIRFQIIYTNVSPYPLWLLPQSESYPVDLFRISKVGDAHQPEKFRFGDQSVAWDARARDVVKLQPQAETVRHVSAAIRSMLPPDYGDSRRGIFLVLPGSAVLLLGSGKYEIQAAFHSSPDHPVSQYLPRGAQLWRGDVVSKPITIDISE